MFASCAARWTECIRRLRPPVGSGDQSPCGGAAGQRRREIVDHGRTAKQGLGCRGVGFDLNQIEDRNGMSREFGTVDDAGCLAAHMQADQRRFPRADQQGSAAYRIANQQQLEIGAQSRFDDSGVLAGGAHRIAEHAEDAGPILAVGEDLLDGIVQSFAGILHFLEQVQS